MLKVQQLTKKYNEQVAVNAINFEVRAGEIVGFLGPNGAGKSSTMKMITGYLPPTDGNVFIEDSFSITEHPIEVKKRIGYLPEHNPLYLDMYVKEFLTFVARLNHVPAHQIPNRVNEMIELTGLTPEKHKKIGQLSKGYRQRVGLAQALIHDPKILILDEPTTGLDPNQIIEIRNLIKELGKTKTILFSSHILAEVEAIASRIIIIHKGNLLIDKNREELAQMTQGQNVFRLEVEKTGLSLEPLQQTKGFLRFDSINPNTFIIYAQQGTDLRKELFELCNSQQNPILSLQKQSTSLEDIFKQLTQS